MLRACCWILVASLLARAGAFAAEPQSKPQFVVSVTNLEATPQITATPTELVAELNANEWCVAKPAPTVARSWFEAPRGVDVKDWLSVVVVSFGEQSQTYAFQFDGSNGSVRVPASVAMRRQLSRGALVWGNPFGKLLSELQVSASEPTDRAKRLLLKIEFADAAAPAPSKTKSKGGLDEALTVPPEKVIPQVQAIVVAAAYEAGWAPVLVPKGPNSIGSRVDPNDAAAKVEIGVLDQACSFRIVLSRGDKESVLSRERVSWEEYHEQLAHLLRQPLGAGASRDFARLSLHGAELLAAQGQRIACVIDDELAALDTTTGQEVWRQRVVQSKLPTVPKKVEQYVVRVDERGQQRLIRWTKSLAEIAWDDGKELKLAPVAAASESAFDLDDKGNAVVVSGDKLMSFAGGKERWTATLKQPVSCGPSLDGGRVIVGSENGELTAFLLTDGKPLWSAPIGPGLVGAIGQVGSLRFVFCAEDETVRAIAADSGKEQWKFAAGDMLALPVAAFGERVLIVTKQNRLALLQPSDGKIVADVIWPTWVVSATPVLVGKAQRLAIGDVAGRVALLDESLKTVWETRLAQRRSGRIAVLEMPVVWQSPKKGDPDDLLSAIETDNLKRQLMLLTTDSLGFLEKLSIEGAK